MIFGPREIGEIDVYGNARYAEGVFHSLGNYISAQSFLIALHYYKIAVPEEERRKLHNFSENISLARVIIRAYERQYD